MSLVAIWERRYIRERDLDSPFMADLDARRLVMTDARMTKLVNEAYDAGKVDARQQARCDVRAGLEKMIEDGALIPRPGTTPGALVQRLFDGGIDAPR